MRNQKKGTSDSSCAEIVSGLWIGSLASLRLIDKDVQVRRQWRVVSLLGSEKLINMARVLIASSSTLVGSHHEIWRLSDSFEGDFLSEKLISTLDFIDESTPSLDGDGLREDKACLVHCAQGVSRSAAVCAAWLISRKKMTLQNSLTAIRQVRGEINPNMGFLASLRALEQSNGDVKMAMKRMKES